VKSLSRITILLILFAFLASCTHLPRSYNESKAVQQMRQDYITLNPEGKFNDHIKRGEVVKGMGFMAVLASWGLPNVRRIPAESSFEYWTYYTEDKASGQFTVYELVFKDETLYGWNVNKNIAANGGFKSSLRYRPVLAGKESSDSGLGESLKRKH
jgi:hypothetical protein